MLAKKHKLNTEQFNYVFKNGKRSFSEHFQFITLDSETPAYAVVISKKSHSAAVTRNKARRAVFGSIQNIQQAHKLKKQQVVILLKKGQHVPDLEALVLELLKNLT